MSGKPNHSDSGDSEEAPKNDSAEDRGPGGSSETELSSKKRQFDDALRDSDQNAKDAGRHARQFLGGFIQGFGKKAAEELWDIVTGNHS